MNNTYLLASQAQGLGPLSSIGGSPAINLPSGYAPSGYAPSGFFNQQVPTQVISNPIVPVTQPLVKNPVIPIQETIVTTTAAPSNSLLLTIDPISRTWKPEELIRTGLNPLSMVIFYLENTRVNIRENGVGILTRDIRAAEIIIQQLQSTAISNEYPRRINYIQLQEQTGRMFALTGEPVFDMSDPRVGKIYYYIVEKLGRVFAVIVLEP